MSIENVAKNEPIKPKKKDKRPFILIALVIVGIAYFSYNKFFHKINTGKIEANGTLEATEIQISSEVAGRIENIAFEEGYKIKKNQLLAIVNDEIYKTQVLQAKANFLANQSKYQSLKVGARKEEVDQASLLKDQSEKLLLGSNKSYYDSKELYENRSITKQQLDTAETQYKTSKNQYETAKANLEQLKSSFKITKSNLLRTKDLYNKQSISTQQLDTAQNQFDIVSAQLKMAEQNLNQSKTLMDGAERNFKNVQNIYENRAQQKLQLHSAEVQKEVAESNLEISKKKLDLIKAQAKKEDLESLKSVALQADAGVKLAQIQLDKTKIKSNVEGIVITKSVEKGEVVNQGSVIATIADLSNMWLRVYVPEYQVNLLKIGQNVNIKTDSSPDKTFTGKIIQISSKAEFTPRNVQTKEERVNQVFGVKIAIANNNLELKSGVPADVEISLK